MNLNSTQKTDLSQGILPVWKFRGETLAALLKRIQAPGAVTYAGRLDPMADGLVLMLLGETCKEKQAYLDLNKTYTFRVLFGVSTDSYDVLGKVTEYKSVGMLTNDVIQKALEHLSKQTIWQYPPYSSRTIKGVPLFMHAKADTLPDILPVKEGRIKNIALNDISIVSLASLTETILADIGKVSGDFRQEEIISLWKDIARDDMEMCMASFTATVTSGVYVRSMAHALGELLQLPALAYSITRTRIGEYEITKPVS
jgi:tRNA pseudouridine(55) synthase